MSDVAIFRASSIGYSPAMHIPSMTSPDEKALYFDVARGYRGLGAVIELGSWLGASTFEICRGLESSGRDWRLTVIDRFRWSALYGQTYPKIALKDGESFLPLFRQHLEPYLDRIDCLAAELKDLPQVFAAPERIELLFVDAPKSWSLLWSVLAFLGPRLIGGARLVFQDFLHITSRQLIWLITSIPELRPLRVVESGTTVVFEATAPIADLAARVPRGISALGVEQLLALWRKACEMLPPARTGEISVGMALDLLLMQADDVAEQVLETARASPGLASLVGSVERFIRLSDEKNRRPLIQAAAFLRAGIRPGEARASWAAQEEEAAATGEGAEGGPLGELRTEQLVAVADALRRPAGANALAVNYALHNGTGAQELRRLMPLFAATVKSGSALLALDLRALALGKDVVEINAGATLHGVALRAFGARSYIGFDERYNPAQRTYTGAVPTVRHRAALPLGDIPALVPGFSFVGDSAALERASADLVIVETRQSRRPLSALLDLALAVARPQGLVCLRWRNPFAWSGHGRRPQRAAEADKADEEQAAVLDWRHIAALRPLPPTLSELRALLEERLVIEEWRPRMEDPAVAIRLRDKVLQAHPRLSPTDLLTRDVTIIARPRTQARGDGSRS